MSQSLTGFLFSLSAYGYSPATTHLYEVLLTILVEFLGDPEPETITPNDLTRFFVYLRTDYTPHRPGGSTQPLSGSTLQNHWKAIRCFFRWAEEELHLKSRPDARLKLPPNNPRVVMPLTEDEVRALVESAEFTRQANTHGRQSFRMKRTTAERDAALIILLLDTGIRCGEASRLDIKDVDLDAGEIAIAPYGNSMRKTKSRVIPLGKVARRLLWRYLTTRPESDPDEPLFVTHDGKRLRRNSIRLLLRHLGKKAGIQNCHPHRLRHTFAVSYLRNGGDVFTLQSLLGHSSLSMVSHYLGIKTARADSRAATGLVGARKASGVAARE